MTVKRRETDATLPKEREREENMRGRDRLTDKQTTMVTDIGCWGLGWAEQTKSGWWQTRMSYALVLSGSWRDI